MKTRMTLLLAIPVCAVALTALSRLGRADDPKPAAPAEKDIPRGEAQGILFAIDAVTSTSVEQQSLIRDTEARLRQEQAQVRQTEKLLAEQRARARELEKRTSELGARLKQLKAAKAR